MAEQTSSPHEAEIARRKLGEVPNDGGAPRDGIRIFINGEEFTGRVELSVDELYDAVYSSILDGDLPVGRKTSPNPDILTENDILRARAAVWAAWKGDGRR